MDKLVENILSVYGKANRQELEDGRKWYKRAKRQCKALATEQGLPVRTVVGVVAATSPNLAWSRNVHTARQVVQGFSQGIDVADIENCSAYPANRSKGYKVMATANRSDSITKVLNGPKITAFYDNIMGGDSVTIDGHARNIAYAERLALKDKRLSIHKAEYDKLASAYRRAASLLGIKASVLQAITWTTWRRINQIKV
jgi:hypothetical protein